MAEGDRAGNHPTAAQAPPEINGSPDQEAKYSAPNATAASQAPAKKPKGKKTADSANTGKLLAAKINQLEIDVTNEKDQEVEIEREVKKANRDLTNLLSGVKNDSSRLEVVHKKFSELVADMQRVTRELTKSKKRADQLQKEKDASKLELSKNVTLKDKLEKLCRELQKDNKRMKVRAQPNELAHHSMFFVYAERYDRRTTVYSRSGKLADGMYSRTSWNPFWVRWKTLSRRKRIL